MSILSEISEKIKCVLDDVALNDLAKKSGLIKRAREITGKDFLLSMVLTATESDFCTLSEIACELNHQGCTVTKQAVHKKCTTNATAFLQEVLAQVLEKLRGKIGCGCLNGIPFIKSIIVVDSSEVRLNNKLANDFKHIRGQGSAFKLQAQIDVLNNKIQNLEICKTNQTDQGYRGHLSSIDIDTLYIGDLGYFRVESFAKIADGKGYFLSRYFKKANIYSDDTGEQIDLNGMLNKASGRTVDMPICLGSSRLKCRLIAMKLDNKAYAKRLTRIKLSWKKDHRLKHVIEPSDRWTIFVTNLPQSVEAQLLFSLYKLRWQIELFFKMMKNFCNLRKIIHTNSCRAMLSAYACLIAIGLLSLVYSGLNIVELSMYNVGKYFMSHLRRFLEKIKIDTLNAVSWISKILCEYAKKESRANRPSTMRKMLELQHVCP